MIHPVIILRLLEHRLFTPLFKKKASTTLSATVSQPNDTRASSLIPSTNVGPPAAFDSIPKLLRPDTLTELRHSLTKPSPFPTDKSRKGQQCSPNTSISSAAPSPNAQTTFTNDLAANASDFSMLLSPAISAAANITAVSPSAATSTRKWFRKNTEKSNQVAIVNDRNSLLHAIVETDLMSPTGVLSKVAVTPLTTGVGEMKMFEKELLNLPTFQLSDSQNPLLPSPTCLTYDFPSHFDETSSPVSMRIDRQAAALNRNGQSTSNLLNGSFATRVPDDEGKFHQTGIAPFSYGDQLS